MGIILIRSFTILKHENIGGFLSGYFFTIIKHGDIGSDCQVSIPGILKRVHIVPYVGWVIIRYLNMGI